MLIYVYANFLQFLQLSCKHVCKFCNGITLEDNLALFQGYILAVEDMIPATLPELSPRRDCLFYRHRNTNVN